METYNYHMKNLKYWTQDIVDIKNNLKIEKFYNKNGDLSTMFLSKKFNVINGLYTFYYNQESNICEKTNHPEYGRDSVRLNYPETNIKLVTSECLDEKKILNLHKKYLKSGELHTIFPSKIKTFSGLHLFYCNKLSNEDDIYLSNNILI